MHRTSDFRLRGKAETVRGRRDCRTAFPQASLRVTGARMCKEAAAVGVSISFLMANVFLSSQSGKADDSMVLFPLGGYIITMFRTNHSVKTGKL